MNNDIETLYRESSQKNVWSLAEYWFTTPLVTVEYQTEEENILCPIPSDGTYTGIMNYLDREWVSVEHVYEGEENEA